MVDTVAPETQNSQTNTQKLMSQSWEEVVFACIVFGIILMVSCSIGKALLGSYGLGIGGAIGSALIGYSFQFFTLSVPNATSVITLNFFTRKEAMYDKGLWFIFPWQTVDEYIPLNVYIEKASCICTTRDGPNMHIEFSIQWQTRTDLLPRYRRMGQQTSSAALTAHAAHFIDQWVAKRKSDHVRGATKKLEDYVREKFEGEGTQGETFHKKLEEAFGVDVLRSQITSVDFDERTQQARETKRISEIFREEALKIVEGAKEAGSPIEMQSALNSLLILEGKVIKHVTEVGGNPLDGFVMAIAEAMGGKRNPSEKGKKA